MKTIYILLTRSQTSISKLIYLVTGGAPFTHVSLAFDDELSTLYSSARKNGYTILPSGPCQEHLNKGIFKIQKGIPCALYALEVPDEAYERAKRRTAHMVAHQDFYRYNTLGAILCAMNISWDRRRHFFCSQFVGEILQKSGAVDLPKTASLMTPCDYRELPGMRCLYQGHLEDLPQRQNMDLGEDETIVSIYLGLALGYARKKVRRFF